jgi:hypothetical protein
MAMSKEQTMAFSRRIVLGVLEGRITRKTSVPYYDDQNYPRLSVEYLEQEDPQWLMERLEDARYGLEGKLEVIIYLEENAERGRTLVGFEGTADAFYDYAIGILGVPEL